MCEKSKNPIVQGFFRRGGVQKRRTLIVSKLESFYDPISQNTNIDTNHCILLIFKLNSFLIQCDEIELNLHKSLFSVAGDQWKDQLKS